MDLFEQEMILTKESIIKRIENIIEDHSSIDDFVYKKLRFFLAIDIPEINVDFIATCLCNNGYAEDYCLNHCSDEFSHYTKDFLALIASLKIIFEI